MILSNIFSNLHVYAIVMIPSSAADVNLSAPFKRQPHKMVKHTQTIRRRQPMNCLIVFDHFVGLLLKGIVQLFWFSDYGLYPLTCNVD